MSRDFVKMNVHMFLDEALKSLLYSWIIFTGLRGSSLRFPPILTTKPGVPRQDYFNVNDLLFTQDSLGNSVTMLALLSNRVQHVLRGKQSIQYCKTEPGAHRARGRALKPEAIQSCLGTPGFVVKTTKPTIFAYRA